MVRRYRANDMATTTLNGTVTASDTTWVVADGSVFPSEGDFFLVCEDEIVLATARSTNSLTVTRAQSGTTNSSHASGKTVRSVITKEDIEGRMIENDLLRTAPYGKIMTANGTILTAADFTEVNSGTGSGIVDGLDGTIEYRSRNHTGDDLSGIIRTYTAAADFDIYCHMSVPTLDADPWNGASGTNRAFGLWFRQTLGGTMKGLAFYPGKTVQAQSRSSYLATPTVDETHGSEGRSAIWAKITGRWNVGGSDSNDQFTFYYSWDSFNWKLLRQYSGAYSSLQIGMWISNFGLAGWPVHLNYWYEDETV